MLESSIAVNVRGGARILVPNALNLITSYVLLEQEDWFEDEIRFLRRYLAPGMRAVDVGASFGSYTMAMAGRVGNSGRVWAFEPTPGTAAHLEATLKLNAASVVELTQAALSDRPGTVAFHAGAHSELNAIAEHAGEGTLEVKAVTLDQLASKHKWDDVDFIKFDVEGHEQEVITGGAAFFASASPLVMIEIRVEGKFDLKPLMALRAAGYRIFRLLPASLLLVPFDEAAQADPFQLNVFACKEDRAQRLEKAGLLAQSAERAPEVPRGAWAEYLHRSPFAATVAQGWPERAGVFAASDVKAYFRGLAAYAHSRASGLHLASRVALIAQAKAEVSEALAKKDTLARRVTLARLHLELGERVVAVETLGRSLSRVADEAAAALVEPFLPPGPQYEAMSVDTPIDWLPYVAGEQFERLAFFSSLYAGGRTLSLLDTLVKSPYCSAETERRWQLARILAGRQAKAEASPRLCRPSEDNLNAAYWCGG